MKVPGAFVTPSHRKPTRGPEIRVPRSGDEECFSAIVEPKIGTTSLFEVSCDELAMNDFPRFPKLFQKRHAIFGAINDVAERRF